MAAKILILHFPRYSRFAKGFSIPFGQFISKRKPRCNSLCFEVSFQVRRGHYSCKPSFESSFEAREGGLEFEFVNSRRNYWPKSLKRFYSRGRKTSKDTKGAKKVEINSEDDNLDEDLEHAEILAKLREKSGLEQGHKVLVIQPDFKWGRNRFHLETVDHMLGEALSLVEAINGWSVVEGRTEPIRKPDSRYFFGKGKLEELTKLVKKLKVAESLSAVFLDVGRLTRRQHAELEELWDVKVFDRFSLIVQIFKERAVTSEAKVQVELAELGYIR
jgi:hypothetical protein